MGSAKGPLKDEKGRPTRLKLSLIAWGHSGDKASAVAKGRRLLARYKRMKGKSIMPMGKGTYGNQVGRPSKKAKKKGKSLLTAKQKTLPPALQKKILKSKANA